MNVDIPREAAIRRKFKILLTVIIAIILLLDTNAVMSIPPNEENLCEKRGRGGIPIRIKNFVIETIPSLTDKQFQAHFRICRHTYEQMLPMMDQILRRGMSAIGRNQIDSEKQFLATLWLLATPDSFRSVGERFNMAKSSLSVAFMRIVKTLNILAPQVISWPNADKRNAIKNRFFLMGGINNIIGAVDGTFIPIKAPNKDPEVYITRKCNYAITLQAICDANMKFTDCFVGYPGSVSDNRIFRNSDIFIKVQEDRQAYFIDDEFIIGDKAYPNLNWCLAPYINRGNLTDQQRYFNLKFSQTRQVIERSFALLFGRFRRFKFLDMNRHDCIPATVIAACVLHNLCLDFNEIDLDGYIREGTIHVQGTDDIVNVQNRGQNERNDGMQKRSLICQRLYRLH